MSNPPTPRLHGFTMQICTLLLLLYPAQFRARYAHEMQVLLGDLSRDFSQEARPEREVTFWLHIFGDMALSGARERWHALTGKNPGGSRQIGGETMGNRSLIGDRAPYVAAVVAGLIVGWLNIHTNETPFVALPLLAAAFTLGFLTPRGAWRWFILVEMWLPLGQIWANLTNTHIPYPNGWSDIGNAAMASGIVALVGTYAGVFGRWILGHLSEDATHETR